MCLALEALELLFCALTLLVWHQNSIQYVKLLLKQFLNESTLPL